MLECDFLVIGGGSAGYAAASLATREGLNVMVVEGAQRVGGLCILRGCMPSKTLLATAASARAVRGASEFGVQASFGGIDGAAMQARKRALIADFASYREGQLSAGKFAFLRGAAHFVDPHTIAVEGPGLSQAIRAKTILISTGSKISTPPIPGLKETGCLDSDAMLESAHIPRSIIVLGGGAIALEAASFYSGAGAVVTLLQRSNRLLKELDPDVSEAAAAGLRHHGVRVETGVEIRSVDHTSAGKVVRFSQGDTVSEIVSEEILCALGRVPASGGMGLDSIGVGLDGSRVAIQATQQTTLPHIFAAGDVCGPLEVVHLAIQQGEVAARNACRLVRDSKQPLAEMDYRLKLFAVFSEPAVSAVGLSEAEAGAAGIPILTATYPFNDHGKSMVEGQTNGFVKLMVHSDTKKILGAAAVGPQAAEIIHEIVVAMFFNATAGELAQVPHYHPTLSEIWTYPAEELS